MAFGESLVVRRNGVVGLHAVHGMELLRYMTVLTTKAGLLINTTIRSLRGGVTMVTI